MERLVVPLARTHERNSYDIHCDDRGASEKAPNDIRPGRLVLDPLRHGGPAQERKGDIVERRAGRQYDHVSGTIRESNDIAGAVGSQQRPHKSGIEF